MNAAAPAAPPRLVIGTAGHIDHGKSSLVRALTGTDPDRLPEERARGMTIDLGFAHANIDGSALWFVDVPGHERFVHNMLAGASGVDLALLVVAADDAAMPQTREHVELLSLLGVRRCVLALTKVDLVDGEWAAAVEEEARALLAAEQLEVLGAVRTSTVTGAGIEELSRLLADLARAHPASATTHTWFRLPIDRAFTVAGRGTVVTGSVAHGTTRVDDNLVLLPRGVPVRVRGLQTHHDACAAAEGRMRLAVNVTGVAHDEVRRGDTLATPGYLAPTHLFDVHLSRLRMPGKALRQTLRLRLHLATAETLAEVRLLEKPTAPLISDCFAQVRAADAVAAVWGQRFILRDETGTRTLGGGGILNAAVRAWSGRRPPRIEGLRALATGNTAARLEAIIRGSEWHTLDPCRLAALAGLPNDAAVRAAVDKLRSGGRVYVLDAGEQQLCFHAAVADALVADLERRLQAHQAANPRLPGLPRSQWPAWMPAACPARLRPVLAEWLIQQGRFALAHEHVVPPGAKLALAPVDQQLYDALLAEFAAARFQPPGFEALACRTPRNEKRLRQLVDLATKQAALVRIAEGFWLHADCWQAATQVVTDALRARGGLTVADIRTLLGSSRKYIVPLVERLDAEGITKRVGDERVLGPKA